MPQKKLLTLVVGGLVLSCVAIAAVALETYGLYTEQPFDPPALRKVTIDTPDPCAALEIPVDCALRDL